MADEPQFASRSDNKRKLDDSTASLPPPRRPSGFSSPPSDAQSVIGAAQPSYNSVPPPPDEIQLAKQRAQEIAAKLFSEAEAKRPRVENGAAGDDSSDRGFSSGPTEHLQKSLGQPMSAQVGSTPQASFSAYGYQGSSKKIEIPNGRVGVIIGKSGDTIKYLQVQSGARIQVTRDADADPHSQTRNVELMGTPEQIAKAEQLIKEVLAEADAGGSGIVSARKFSGVQSGGEHFTMKVPNNKVGLIIGKGGETIKNMQAQTGARIQVIPLHLPPGDASTERNVHIDGTQEQIESAKQLVNEVISENRARNPPASGYPPQGYGVSRPPSSWTPTGPPTMQQPGYGYMQPGAYPGQPPQYNVCQPPYGSYPPPPASSGYSSGWDQNSNPQTQSTTAGTGYDYYNQQQALGSSSNPADNSSYNYGQQPNYGDSYPQSTVGQQPNYGQDSYGTGYQTQSGYTQPPSNVQTGYDQQGYGSAHTYGGSANPTPDGSASTYGGPAQGPSAQQASQVQPSSTQQGYPSQQSSANSGGYTSQGSAQAGYGMATSSQPGYGSQPLQSGYGQSGPIVTAPVYGQASQVQRPPTQAAYGQGQLSQTSQAGYLTPSPGQSGYGSQSGYAQDSAHPRAPSSGYGPGGSQSSYGQQQPYGAPSQSQPPYAQQPYSASSYTQPPAYSGDNAAHGAYDSPVSVQPVSSGVTKASPKS